MPPDKHVFICVMWLLLLGARSTTGNRRSNGRNKQSNLDEHQSIEKALKMRTDDDTQSYISRVQEIFCPLIDMCDFYSQEYSEEIPSFLEPIMFCETFCQSCQCDDECVSYGDCCPDFDNSSAIFSTSKSELTCLPLSLNQTSEIPSIASYQKAYMMQGTCPESFKNSDIIKKCEHVTWESRDLEERVPVTANKSNTFTNKYCAICNGVDSYSPWVINLVCDNQFHIPSTLSYTQVLNRMWGESGCNFILSMPSQLHSLDLRACTPYNERQLISICNVTGKWKNYDKNIEDSCHAYTLVFNKTYRNIFCFICNAENYVLPCEKPTEGEIGGLVSISTIVNITDQEGEERKSSETCGCGFIMDVNQECREVHCPPGKWLKDDKCVTMVKLWKTPMYNFLAVYSVVPNITVRSCIDDERNGITYLAETLDFLLLPDKLRGKLYNDQVVIDGLVEYTPAECTNGSPHTFKRTLHKVQMEAKFSLLGHHDFDRSVIEEGLYQMTLSRFVFNLPNYGSVRLEPDVNSTYIARHNPSLDKYVPGVTLRKENMENSTITSKLPKYELNVTKLLYCPYVVLDMSECELRDEHRKLYVSKLKAEYLYIDFEVVGDKEVHICADVLRTFSSTVSTFSRSNCDRVLTCLLAFLLVVIHCF